MKRYFFSFMLLSTLSAMAYADNGQIAVWPQAENFYNSKDVTANRRVIEPAANNGYYSQQNMQPMPMQQPMPMSYAQPPALAYPPAGFMPQGSSQGFPLSMPSFSTPAVTMSSIPNTMPNYGGMPFSSMPNSRSMPFSSGNFPSNNGFGNMMPFLGGNGFSGMPFGFGY